MAKLDVKMAKGRKLYCRRVILDAAKSSSRNARQMARQLIPGVFTKEAQIACTISGYTGRTGKNKDIKMKALHPEAVDAIASK